jgi:hypothetical protein
MVDVGKIVAVLVGVGVTVSNVGLTAGVGMVVEVGRGVAGVVQAVSIAKMRKTHGITFIDYLSR